MFAKSVKQEDGTIINVKSEPGDYDGFRRPIFPRRLHNTKDTAFIIEEDEKTMDTPTNRDLRLFKSPSPEKKPQLPAESGTNASASMPIDSLAATTPSPANVDAMDVGTLLHSDLSDSFVSPST